MLLLAAFLGGLFLFFGAILFVTGRAPSPVGSAIAAVGGPFRLEDQNGKPFTDQDMMGRPFLVFFGFTHCPDICPAELQVIAQALDKLSDKAKKVVPIFITLDPERDTPQVMADYLKSFGPNFVGLSGTADDIAAAAKAYHVAHTKIENKDSPGDYTIDHSALVYLMGPDGKYVTHLSYGTSPDELAEKLDKLVQ